MRVRSLQTGTVQDALLAQEERFLSTTLRIAEGKTV